MTRRITLTRQQVEIVRALADHNMVVIAAARALHYTNGGLRYQLERIHTRTGLNPLNFFDLQKLLLLEEGASMNRYYCLSRPPTLGNLPHLRLWDAETFTERRYVPEIDGMAWGWVEFENELTPAEVAEYELIRQPRR